MALAPEDIINMALRRIAFPTPVGFIYEGSKAARAAIDIYGQERDALMRSQDWDFARKATGLSLLKTAPVGGYGMTSWTSAYPPPPWIYEYTYPVDCLEIRSVRPTPVLIIEYDPQPNVFVLGNDATVSPAKVILTNLAGAQAVYTGRITDPSVWQASFIEALVGVLALRLQAALAPSPEADKEREADAMQSTAMAVGRMG